MNPKFNFFSFQKENLAEDDRMLLKEGIIGVIKVPKKGKKDYKMSNYYWFLFNDMLLCCSKSMIGSGVQNISQVSRASVNINKIIEKNNLTAYKYKKHMYIHRLIINDLPDSPSNFFFFTSSLFL